MQRRISTTADNLKISTKGKKFLMENLPTTVLSFHNKETMFDSLKTWTLSKRHKNKLCQITSGPPNERGANTDRDLVNTETNVNLPYCCCLNHHECSQYCTYDPNRPPIPESYDESNEVWDQIVSVVISHGKNISLF